MRSRTSATAFTTMVVGTSLRNVVVATGSVPIELPGAPVDHRRILSSDDVLRLDRVPTSGLVVGGGAGGLKAAVEAAATIFWALASLIATTVAAFA